jgi:peptidoglycan/xylan/chitin deacetylase (PgdA/CDA1 family)
MISRAVRRGIKAAVLPAGMARRPRSTDLTILLYHRVGLGDREIDLDVRAFKEQLEILASVGSATSLDEALDGGGRRRGVVLTFDDGFRDFIDHVLPLLVDHRIPALLYLATGFVANGAASVVPRDEALTWGMLREAISTGLVAVGSHTHSHVDLSKASRDDARNEMTRSKELIEDRLGIPCRHFAYPWAVASPMADRAARELFESAALDAWRTNRGSSFDSHRLGRTPVLRSDSPFFFRAKVRGQLDGEAWAYRVLRRGPWGRA